MKKKMLNNENKLVIEESEIPIESNLGLLAYGDIAFVAWREIKKKAIKKGTNDKK